MSVSKTADQGSNPCARATNENRNKVAGIKTYLTETYDEMVNQVTWPTWKELQSSALLVLVASAIIALLIFLMDYIFGINGKESIWQGVLGFIYQILSDL